MTPGISGTGPYAEIRRLRQEIRECDYEIGLVTAGMKRRLGKRQLEAVRAGKRARVKQILADLKARKSIIKQD